MSVTQQYVINVAWILSHDGSMGLVYLPTFCLIFLVGQYTIPIHSYGIWYLFQDASRNLGKNHATHQPGTQIGRSGGLGFSRSSGAVLSLFYLEPFTSRLSVTRVPSFRMCGKGELLRSQTHPSSMGLVDLPTI